MSYLNLFMFAMLTLVLGANYPVLFVGWEGVGLCSYLLIGFWFDKQSAADAGKKAFIVNRIGDAGFLLGMFLIFVTFGTPRLPHGDGGGRRTCRWRRPGAATLTVIALCLFVGAAGKSAQLPLYVWLPDAMEGPTPVSRPHPRRDHGDGGRLHGGALLRDLLARARTAMFVVAIVGALTAIFAASIGLVQNDIKRVLAYSTVSQLGYMFLACGVGAFAAGVFHLMTHAFFKALLFLGSGSVIHGMSGEQDMRKMGGLKVEDARGPTARCSWAASPSPASRPWPASSRRTRSSGRPSRSAATAAIVWAHRLRGRGHDRVLHVPPLPHDVQRRASAAATRPSTTSTSRRRTMTRAAAGPGRGLDPRGLPGRARRPRLRRHPELLRALPASRCSSRAHHALARGLHGRRARPRASRYALMARERGDRGARASSSPRASTSAHPEIAERPGRVASPAPTACSRTSTTWTSSTAPCSCAAWPWAAATRSTPSTASSSTAATARCGPASASTASPGWPATSWRALSNFWDRWIVDGLVNLTAFVLDNLSYVFRAVQNGLVQHYALWRC